MLLTAKYVIPVTSSYIEDGGIVVRGSDIVDIGHADYLREKYPDEEVHDYGLAALQPGFVDLHTHLGYTALRGMFDDLPYAEWKREVLRREPFFSQEDWENSARLGALEAVASGITTIADITTSGCAFTAAQESGLRAVIYREVTTVHADHVDAVIQKGAEDLERMRAQADMSRISFGIAPGPIYACHPKLFQAVADYATEQGIPVALHLAGSQEEADFVRYGSSPFSIHASEREMLHQRVSESGEVLPWMPTGTSSTRYVVNWGILDAPDVLAIHCVHVDERDIDILREKDVAVAYCPRINAKLGMGMAPVVELRRAGLRIGLGTDSPAAIDTTDMIDEMRFGLMMNRALNSDTKRHLTSDGALRMATIEGARALHLDEWIGSLEPGKKADIIAIDLHNSHQNPTTNPQSAIIYTANQDNVKMTMVGGRILYDNFVHVSGVDRDGIVEHAKALRVRIRSEVSDGTLRDELMSKVGEDERERYNR